MKQVLLRELEWFRRLSAVRHWVHDVLIFNTGVALATTSSIWIVPGVCPKVEYLEGYFFSPFSLFFFLILQPLLSPFILYSFFRIIPKDF
jgi:hypothetical protein